jgi:hypothetical protein
VPRGPAAARRSGARVPLPEPRLPRSTKASADDVTAFLAERRRYYTDTPANSTTPGSAMMSAQEPLSGAPVPSPHDVAARFTLGSVSARAPWWAAHWLTDGHDGEAGIGPLGCGGSLQNGDW